MQELLGEALRPQEAVKILVETGRRVFFRADQEVEEVGGDRVSNAGILMDLGAIGLAGQD